MFMRLFIFTIYIIICTFFICFIFFIFKEQLYFFIDRTSQFFNLEVKIIILILGLAITFIVIFTWEALIKIVRSIKKYFKQTCKMNNTIKNKELLDLHGGKQ